MRLFALCGVLPGLLWLGGCARARVTTAIQADGSSIRTIVLSGQARPDGGKVWPTLEDIFVIPKGAEWKTKEQKENGNRELTLERVLPLGAETAGDISIKDGEQGKIKLVNEAKVTRIGPHRFEYRETLKWRGDPEALLGQIKVEDLKNIRALLPRALATDANARALVDKVAMLSTPVLFGPGEPLLALGPLHPDLAVRRLGQRMGALVVQALADQFGDQMQPAERREVARRLLQETFTSTQLSQPDVVGAVVPSTPSKSAGLTPLMFILKTPGKIVSSNGEWDEFTGELFWALFEEAAAYQDVVLSAVVEEQ